MIGDYTINRDYPKNPLFGVSSLIIKNNKVLIVKRSSKPEIWSLPGGLVELGETQRSAAIREAREETNINIKIIKFLENLDIIIKDEKNQIKKHYILAVFSGEYINGNIIAGDDALDAKWLPIQDIKNIDMTNGTDQFIMKYSK